jgi:hypothetical protein
MQRFARVITLLIAVLALSITLAGCGGDSDKDASTTAATGSANSGVTAKAGSTGEVVATVPVQAGSGNDANVNVSKPKLYVVTSKNELESLQSKLGPSTDIAAPDFTKRQIVAVVLPSQKLGTQLAISNVTPKDANTFNVEAVYLPPGKGCKKTGESSVPYTVVQTDKMNGKGKLKITKQVQSPC